MTDSENYIPFHKILIDNGWYSVDEQLYPPYGRFLFWLSGNEAVPILVIEKIHDRTKGSLQKLLRTTNKENFERHIKDLANLVKITETIISENFPKTK